VQNAALLAQGGVPDCLLCVRTAQLAQALVQLRLQRLAPEPRLAPVRELVREREQAQQMLLLAQRPEQRSTS